MSGLGHLGHALFAGDVRYDFIGHRRRWYTISAVLVLVSLVAVLTRGLTMGVEFKGGSVFTVPTATGTVAQAETAVADSGVTSVPPIVTDVRGAGDRSLRVQTVSLDVADTQKVVVSLAKEFDVSIDSVTSQVIGPSWGKQITSKAVTSLIVFLVLIVLFLSIVFEWKMAVAALVALIHDLIITVGIYSLVGFEVTPATIIGLLTILGYSLYDTVVVFDKVKENTRGIAAGNRMTYGQAANLAVNQTLIRSINTSVVGLLPVAALLFVGAYLLGAGTLKDLALVLFVGIAVGTYSSIFLATPLVVDLKEREPANQALARRVAARQGAAAATAAVAVGASRGSAASTDTGDGDDAATAPAPAAAAPGGAARPGQRNQPRRSTGGKRRPGGKRR